MEAETVDGMDLFACRAAAERLIAAIRADRKPRFVEAITYRYRGHGAADPGHYRTRQEVDEWRARDPIPAFAQRLEAEGVLSGDKREAIDAEATARVDAAVAFAEASPLPAPESLYDDVYVLDRVARGTYSVRTTDPAAHPAQAAEPDGATDEIPQQITDALLAGEDAALRGGEGT